MTNKDDIRAALRETEATPYDEIDRIIEDFRTDSLSKRKRLARELAWVHECLMILAANDQIIPNKKGADDGFTLTDLMHYSRQLAERWDKMFKLRPPHSITESFLTRYTNIYSLNTQFTYWLRDPDCPFIKTGKKILGRFSAVPGVPQTEYRLHPEIRDPGFLQSTYREQLVEVISRLQSRTK